VNLLFQNKLREASIKRHEKHKNSYFKNQLIKKIYDQLDPHIISSLCFLCTAVNTQKTSWN